MVKKIAVLPVILLAALISLGAKSEDLNKNKKASTSISSTAPAKKTEAELKQVSQEAWPIMENILIAMKEQKHDTYIRDFNAAMRAAYTKKVFKKNNKFLKSRLGTYSSAQLRKIEKMNQHYILFYHAVFSREPAPVIIRLVLERVDKKLQVIFLSFNSPALQKPAPKKKWWWPFSWFS